MLDEITDYARPLRHHDGHVQNVGHLADGKLGARGRPAPDNIGYWLNSYTQNRMATDQSTRAHGEPPGIEQCSSTGGFLQNPLGRVHLEDLGSTPPTMPPSVL